MTDANSQFFAILTTVGKAKQANADALGIPWLITQMGVGDANNIDPVIPTEGQTKLINEWRRKPLNRLFVDPVNPAVLIAEQIIPADEGGRWIREIGLYDADGDLVAVANCAPSFKPLLSQGSGRTQIVRMNFIVTSTGNIQLKIDPAVVLATRAFVEAAILEVLPKNKTPGQWTRVKTNDRGIVVEGDNPDTLAGMGIKDTYTKTQIEAMIAQASALPVGATVAFPVDKVAPGFLELDGSVKSIAVYPDLAAFLGTAFNKGDEGAGNFRLPESRGEFLRGWDHGRGVDVGRAIGSSQLGQVESHDHATRSGLGITGSGSNALVAYANTTVGTPLSTGAMSFYGGNETRPRNLAVMWCIKAWNAPINQGNIDIQALAALATQATEVKLGTAKIATQTLTDAGVDDATIVTPKKLRWGFQILKAANGYIVFPSWLGGLVIQWGIFTGNGTNDLAVPYPIQFPNAAFVVQATLQYTPSSPVNGYVDVSQGVSKTSFWAKHTFSGPTTINWLAIGH
ncbi:phage tail protein [Pseudomonas sp. TNT2022 ID233]|uniref:phage tail protein n=1 Tax=Pseudomonas aphyarum TaxID=2942629 RepID=UPI00235E7447|nr:phage tail protein [Pseudomonas aphyarum]MDD1136042.1 phage tail protein [Pseudomonas aphyarum]